MENPIPQIPFDRPDSVEALIEAMTPTIYENLKTAIELGKWGDGTRLSAEQVESCLQTIILYEAKHVEAEARIEATLPTGCSKDS
ncbi:MAG: DUF1315 family protein [Gammaproteobacteria bacterium]|jgi:uncharacterized protein YeaC (DUF1315 family)|nr:DUF1315 family protein [Gammaproteobacteria bacterium]